MLTEKWIFRFHELAKQIATWSNDMHTKVGAIIVNDDKRILSLGYNGLPSGANDNIKNRFQRPHKYLFMEHAERNAINNAARIGVPLKDSSIICTLFPCESCTRSIINAGIKNIYTTKPDDLPEHYKKNVKFSLDLLEEVGVNIYYID